LGPKRVARSALEKMGLNTMSYIYFLGVLMFISLLKRLILSNPLLLFNKSTNLDIYLDNIVFYIFYKSLYLKISSFLCAAFYLMS